MSTKFFPICMVVLSICASVVYFKSGNVKMGIYWLSSASLISAVTF